MPIIITSPTVATILVSDLLTRLDDLMSDEDRERWTVDERIRWFNDAAREIVLRRPAARAVTQNIALVEGALQETPARTAQVLDVTRNMAPGELGGRPISIADRLLIDRAEPGWQSLTPTDTIYHYMLDDRSPTTFYVYPPAAAGTVVEALLALPPNEVSSADDEIDLRPEFTNAIIDWALYRCHSKDSEYAQGAVAAQHYQAFTAAIGEPAQIAQANSAKGNSV